MSNRSMEDDFQRKRLRYAEVVSSICSALKEHRDHEDYKIVFTQILPDAETQVRIDTKPEKDGLYQIEVTNNRTDAVFNSTPITDVFHKKLPSLRGITHASVEELPSLLTSLVSAKPYFGITVNLNKGYLPEKVLGRY